jgi:hypothetical protein
MRVVINSWPFWARAVGRAWAVYERMGYAKEALLRRIQPGRMRILPHSWPLWARMCACDLHFCDFLQERDVRSKAIFHLGTGGHHIVGLRNRFDDMCNVIMGVTVSPNEIRSYVKLVVRDPILGQNYKVLFADVHDLQAASLPNFDLVTLFHLGEFGSATGSGHLLSDEGVLGLLTSKLKPGGLLAVYRQSLGYRRLQPIIAAAMAAGKLEHREDYKSLQILQVSAPTQN